MKSFFSILFLGLAICCQAQKLHRHEVTVGYYGGYFFDDTPFKFQSLRVLRQNKNLPTLTYTYRINKRFFVSALHGVHHYGYIGDRNIYSLEPIDGVFSRYIRRFRIGAGYQFVSKPLILRTSGGLVCNKGDRARDLWYYHPTWAEKYVTYEDYKDFGASYGLTVQHPIYWRFFGELSVDYLHMFSGLDREQLMPSYRIGFKF